MALVTATLLHLSEIAKGTTFVGRKDWYEVAQELITSVIENLRERSAVGVIGADVVIFVERNTLIVDVNVITENTDTHKTEGVAEAPVAPIMSRALAKVGIAGVEPRVMTAAQEIEGHGIPRGEHIALELLEVSTAPTVIVTYQLSSLCEAVTI